METAVRLASDEATVVVQTDWAPAEARLWVAESATPDFRQARWVERELPGTATGWEARVAVAGTGYTAFFAELAFEREGLKLYVSSPARVLGP